MTIIALASTDRKFARELRLQLVGWGYRPWMADPEESILLERCMSPLVSPLDR